MTYIIYYFVYLISQVFEKKAFMKEKCFMKRKDLMKRFIFLLMHELHSLV